MNKLIGLEIRKPKKLKHVGKDFSYYTAQYT